MELKNKIVRKLNKVIRIFNSINYFFRYTWKTYGSDSRLRVMEIYLEDVGVKSISLSPDKYYYTFIFNDGTEIKFWNANRWYAFMSQGEATFSNGKSFKWAGVMPPRSVLFKYKRIIKEYEKINDPAVKSDGYSEYLPLKLVRKNKLLKIEDNI
jgi:hypothetical protein